MEYHFSECGGLTDRPRHQESTSGSFWDHVEMNPVMAHFAERVHCKCPTCAVDTQAAAVTDAWDPSASRCLTCLRTLLSTAGLVYIIALAAVHRAKRLAAREVAAFA